MRERLGAIASEPRSTRSIPGGRWDVDELEADHPDGEYRAGDDAGRWDPGGVDPGRSARDDPDRWGPGRVDPDGERSAGDDAGRWGPGWVDSGGGRSGRDDGDPRGPGWEELDPERSAGDGAGDWAREREGRDQRRVVGDDAGDRVRDVEWPGRGRDVDDWPRTAEGPKRNFTVGGRGAEVEGPRTPHWLREPPDRDARWHERLIPERLRGTRLDPGRRGLLVLGVVGLVALLLAATAVHRESPVAQPVPPLPAVRTAAGAATTATVPVPPAPPTGDPSPAPPSGRSAELVVSVIGLVEHPGLLYLPPGSRVADALAVAVAQDGADLGGLNLAQRLADGDQVVVGSAGPQPGPPRLGSVVVPGGQRPAAPGGSPGAPASSSPAAKVDLNTATEAELDALPGVGPTTALAILAWRTEHGRFTSIDQLAEVTGIGPSRLARLRNLVTV
ncbi:competence protein ComEA [Nocardia mexicana]|uniref:Competence protein ComEA n=2 Tax=Nocardia mexicana TaxID=279262 RepID=A0A370HCP9_9NOCA|nr:competence protein ComEA [Nocardia mexicana]